MKKKRAPRLLLAGLCSVVLLAAVLGVGACSASQGTEGADAASDGLPPLTESISVTGTTPAHEVFESSTDTATAYTGTDPNAIIEQLCTTGCHTAENLLAYSADPAVVQSELESMASYVEPALTPEQTTALIEFYNGR